MKKERQFPKRCGQPYKRYVPTLEETLVYFSLLLRPEAMSGHQRAAEMGLQYKGFTKREFTKEWTLARELAEKCKPRRESTFGAYVFKKLSPEAQRTWNALNFWTEHRDGAAHVERILSGSTKLVRQEIFVHSLVSTNFDLSKACRLAGISKELLDQWRVRDPEFGQLVEEIQWHKKNFFEQAMFDLVKERHPLATIWANKTVNADRGYSEKIRMEHTIDPNAVNFEELDLDLDTRRKVLDAIRRKREKEQGADPKTLPRPIDVPAIAERAA